MLITETVREALQSLWSAKQRTLLALLGVVIGIGSVIAMVSVGQVVKNESLKQFSEMSTDVVTIYKAHGHSDDGFSRGMNLKECVEIPKYCPGVKAVAPYTTAHAPGKIAGRTTHLPFMGVTESFFSLNRLRIAQGRMLSDLDVMMFYCVIGVNLREQLANTGVQNPVGHKLFFAGRLFTVVGVLEYAAPNMMRPGELNQGLLIPVSTALRLPDGGGVNNVLARLTAAEKWRTAKTQILSYFESRPKPTGVDIRSAEQLLEQIQGQMRLFTLLLGAVGSISLVVGGVGVMNVMLVSVAERKREIGVRRALGARRRDIRAQFLVEAVCLCLVGGVLGVALGVGGCYVVCRLNAWEFLVSWFAIALGVGVSCLVGVFFGFYPARQAAKLRPIDALREG